ncbi:hypothetical protein N7532_004994 [Penicillium argentinense]|uniref:Uncharacterized protein n=1 Tax=Penicillium argentinense TaxID=1131581 RepID=A0A9W9K9H9_9EURO|nr:uncharacterized protein N7532_004994 [Penicillium argentinense]KAJ5097993.1 hypothetical protein N7532_004994 [Penicillium argentinense]
MTDGISNEQSSEIMAFRRDDTPLDQLLRLTTTSSVLSNVANTIDSSDNHACQCFLEDCLAQRDRILAWYSRWENDIGGSPALLEGHGFPFSNLSPTDDLFGSAYFFSSCDNARLLLIFFNAMRLVHPLIYQAKALVSPYAHNKLFDDEDYLLEGYYADQIARSIPYCLRDEHQSCFAHLSVILVTQLSKTYIDLRSPGRFMWCQEGFEVIASIGFICASHLKAIMLERWIRAGLPGPISISAADSGAKGERLEIPSLPSFMSFPTAAIGLTSQGANSKP